MTRNEAEQLRSVIEQLTGSASCEQLDNKTAYEARTLFAHTPVWDGRLVTVGQRIRWGDQLLAATADLWATDENNPDNAPTLWEEILYRDGYRVLTGPISASNPVRPGEWCWEDDVLWACIYPNVCTYRPSEYESAWERVNEG